MGYNSFILVVMLFDKMNFINICPHLECPAAICVNTRMDDDIRTSGTSPMR